MRENVIRWTLVLLTAVGCTPQERAEKGSQENGQTQFEEEGPATEEMNHHQSQTKQKQRTSFNEMKSAPKKGAAKLAIEKER